MNTLLAPLDWKDYELIDSGDREKLERFGEYLFVRPEPKALWRKALSQADWSKADAVYERHSTGGGQWLFHKEVPSSWVINWRHLCFLIKPTGFKHMGIFPEQAVLWSWIHDKVKASEQPINVLNLFAYTGGSTLAALAAGAKVTHVDASKDSVNWAHENVKLSGLEGKPVRWIVDDVIKYIKREVRRGVKYDAIIMDPPQFGRGANGQVWKIEEDLPNLLALCQEVLSDMPLFFIINAYGVDFTSVVLSNLLTQTMSKYKGTIDAGELVLKQQSNNLLLSTGIYGRWEGV